MSKHKFTTTKAVIVIREEDDEEQLTYVKSAYHNMYWKIYEDAYGEVFTDRIKEDLVPDEVLKILKQP